MADLLGGGEGGKSTLHGFQNFASNGLNCFKAYLLGGFQVLAWGNSILYGFSFIGYWLILLVLASSLGQCIGVRGHGCKAVPIFGKQILQTEIRDLENCFLLAIHGQISRIISAQRLFSCVRYWSTIFCSTFFLYFLFPLVFI